MEIYFAVEYSLRKMLTGSGVRKRKKTIFERLDNAVIIKIGTLLRFISGHTTFAWQRKIDILTWSQVFKTLFFTVL